MMVKGKVRVLVPVWHTAYQHNLFKLRERYPEVEFDLLWWRGMTWKRWQRPLPDGVRVVGSVEPGRYDMCICGTSTYMQEFHWQPFWLCKNSGAPAIHTFCAIPSKKEDIDLYKSRVGVDNLFCVNTPETARRIGMTNFWLNRIGKDPGEWGECNHSPKVYCSMPLDFGANETDNAWENGVDYYRIFTRKFENVSRPHDANPQSFEEYVKWCKGFGIFVNPCLMSAHPESRVEALMMGQVVLSAPMCDDAEFFKDCPGIFFDIDPYRLAEVCQELVDNPGVVERLGKENREWALKNCHIDDFHDKWRSIIKEVTGK